MFAYQWHFEFLGNYINILFQGLLTTLELSIIVILATTLFGTFIGILMTNHSRWVRFIFFGMVDVVRSIPILVLVLWVYYLLPTIGLRGVPAFWSAALALIINNTAFFADIIRGGIDGIPKGNILAARALGMNRIVTLHRIIIPEVYRSVFPSVVLLYISIVRLTSIASIIAVYELTHVGELIIARTFKSFEVYTAIAVFYMAVVLPLTLLSRKIENSKLFLKRTV